MLTIMIPTMNRSDFLIRLLNYYADTGFKHWIVIGDSSNAEHVEQTKNAIKNLEGKLKIIYREYPGLNVAECTQQMLQSVSTPYAVYIADDDFLVPNGLEHCMQFLENHPDYSAAHGAAIGSRLLSSGPYGQLANIFNYNLPSIEAETASQRILDFLNNYSVPQFCIHRTECWRAMYKDVNLLKDRSFADELLPCCLSVIQGKVKQLECFYLLRQFHDMRYFLPDIYDWINSPNWKPSYKIFLDRLAEELAQQDGIALNKARSIVKHAFRLYLDIRPYRLIYILSWRGRYGQLVLDTYHRIKKAAKYITGIQHTQRMADYDRQNHSVSLSELLNPSSPYYADFMPIYRAVTTPPIKNHEITRDLH